MFKLISKRDGQKNLMGLYNSYEDAYTDGRDYIRDMFAISRCDVQINHKKEQCKWSFDLGVIFYFENDDCVHSSVEFIGIEPVDLQESYELQAAIDLFNSDTFKKEYPELHKCVSQFIAAKFK